MFCSKCGNPSDDNTVVYPFYGNSVEMNNIPETDAADEADKKSASGLSSAAIVLGIIGIILAWLFALLGYVFGGGALALALVGKHKDDKNKKARTGIVLSAIAIICAAINSVLGILLMSGLFV